MHIGSILLLELELQQMHVAHKLEGWAIVGKN